MGTPTQSGGTASETPGSEATNGFTGWSPETDRTVYTVRNGWDGTAPAAYANSTAYAVGKAVTYNGNTYVVKSAVASNNVTAPDVNSKFVLLDNHRGGSEAPDATSRKKQYYR